MNSFTLVVPMICAPIRRHVGVIGAVNSHRTPQPPSSEAPVNAQSFSDRIAFRVNEYGLEQSNGDQAFIISIHVIPGVAGQFCQPVATTELTEFTGVLVGQCGRVAAQCLGRAGKQQWFSGEALGNQRACVSAAGSEIRCR